MDKGIVKFKDIEIYKNNKKIPKNKLNWISINKNKIFYLSMTNSRLYFFIDQIKKKNNKIKINKFKLNDNLESISFNYKGDWQLDNKTIKVNDDYKIIFNKQKDFNKI